MKNIEIERKFLVTSEVYKDLAVGQHTIMQGYLCKEPDRTVRVRIKDDKAYLTIKSKPNDTGLAHDGKYGANFGDIVGTANKTPNNATKTIANFLNLPLPFFIQQTQLRSY